MMKETAVAAAPTIGPAVVTIAGLDVPLLAFGISVASLLLARGIAPEPTRKLTKRQEWALTTLLAIILLLLVSGRFGGGKLSEGMAAIWGIGLGFSGLLIIDVIGNRILKAIKALIGADEGTPSG